MELVPNDPGGGAGGPHAFHIFVRRSVRGDRVAGFGDRVFDGLSDMTPIAPCYSLHQMVDCQLRGHFPGPVPTNAIGETGK